MSAMHKASNAAAKAEKTAMAKVKEEIRLREKRQVQADAELKDARLKLVHRFSLGELQRVVAEKERRLVASNKTPVRKRSSEMPPPPPLPPQTRTKATPSQKGD